MRNGVGAWPPDSRAHATVSYAHFVSPLGLVFNCWRPIQPGHCQAGNYGCILHGL